MKKFALFATLILFTCCCIAQATKSITADSLRYREEYDVLKSNKKIRQGNYKLTIARTGKTLTTGFYKNNCKDSLWREYDGNDHMIAEGYYRNGRKYGEWQYFDSKQNVINKFDFANNQLTYHQITTADTADLHTVIKPQDTTTIKLDRAPIYLGGDVLISSRLFITGHRL